jgi:thiol-disulfide isomerase/thioredoxin
MGITLKHGWSSNNRAIWGFLAVVMLGLLAVYGCTSSAQDIGGGQGESGTVNVNGSNPETAPDVGRLAPDFVLVDLEGDMFRLNNLRGKTVFLNFWATWCPPCRAEMPEIEAIYQSYKDKEVAVIGVDIAENKDMVLQYVKQSGYSWTFVLDTKGEVATNYRITAIPTSFFIDKEGVIRVVNIGAMTRREIQTALAEVMR